MRLSQDQIVERLAVLEVQAVGMLEQVPIMARAMCPALVQSAENHIKQIAKLRQELEQSS